MKKVYTAPQILFESFTLSTNIAAGCEAIVDNSTKGICAYTYEDEFAGSVSIFTAEVSGCLAGGEVVPDNHDGICYHVPFEEYNLFAS